MFGRQRENMTFWNTVLFCSILSIAYSRDAPARLDLCNRNSTWSLCPNQASQNLPPRPTPPPPPQGPPPSGNTTSYCQQYEPHYTFYCTGGGNDNPQATEFCKAYAVSCNVSPQQPQLTPQQIAELCQKYQSQAQQFCTGDEKGQVKDLCDKYRQYCTGQPSSGPPAPVPPPSPLEDKIQYCGQFQSYYQYYCVSSPQLAQQDPQVNGFCQSYQSTCSNLPSNALAGYANANNSAQVRHICSQYTSMADAYCPGYETVELRQYCNYYRVYCQGKKPFPVIDGNVGINTKNWGVAGIPFYPFNPQGAIAGGQRSDVGFGDWGASVTKRKGVSDFWDSQNKTSANWQQGQYGVGRTWNVPVVGVGGYRRNGVSLGGITNPADFPSLFSGGVPLPGPGLAGISGLAGQPNPLAFGNSLGALGSGGVLGRRRRRRSMILQFLLKR